MSKEKEWGSHIELVAIGELFGAPILIINDSLDSDCQTWIYPKHLKHTSVLLLGFSIANHHYYSSGRYVID